MKFTSEVPTVRGFYLFRMDEHSPISHRFVYDDTYCQAGSTKTASCTIGGEWCRLVPAEEVEKAYEEGYNDGRDEDTCAGFNESRAKRVMEGKE